MVRVVTNAEAFLGEVRGAFRASAKDVQDEAGRRSRSSTITASGTVDELGPGHLRVRFSAVFAKARERGAYIRPRKGRQGRNGRPAMLKFADGTFRPSARIRKRPYLEPAGKMWDGFLMSRLRAIGAGAQRTR